MMNSGTFLIHSFKANRSQTIYSCKRKATLILSLLKKIDEFPSFMTINSPEAATSNIYSVFSPYQLRTYWIEAFGMYRHQNNLSWDKLISRALLLDIIAYTDGYPNWENMQHHLSNSTNNFKTFSLKNDHTPCDSLMGGGRVCVYWDDINHNDNGINLHNPSQEFGQLEIGYAWGYSGSSVRELSRALLYSIDPLLTIHSGELTEGFLTYFTQNKPEMLLTEIEIRQFINHFKKNKEIPLRLDPSMIKKKYTLIDLMQNAKPYTGSMLQIITEH